MTSTPGRAIPQSGVVAFTARQRSAVAGADATSNTDKLTSEQASAVIGDPIPLVFCNRRNGIGGCWINPAATEARFASLDGDVLRVRYRLVLSDGELGGISNVWQGSELRAGPGAVATPERPLAQVEWTYNARPLGWTPGNFVRQNWRLSTSINTQEVTGAAVASEEEIAEAKARVTITSKSDYVTSFQFKAEMIDWGSRVPGLISGSNGTGEGSTGPGFASTFVNPRPLRNLGDWSFSRERSTDPQRIELVHEEEVYWNGAFIPRATYRCTTTEESIEPTRIIEIPEYTGDGRGSYQGLSVLSFTDTYPPGVDTWNQQIHVFIEDGVQVETLLDPEATNESDLLPDLARHLLQIRGQPAALIDTDNLTAAAEFNQANGLLFNGVLVVPANVRDWLYRIAPFYLLRVSNRQGAIGLRPAVPTNPDGTIDTGPVTPAFTFTEDHVKPGSFRQEIIGAADRRPFTAVMLWRDQPLDQIGMTRATDVVRDDAPDAPAEQFDLSEFCCTEAHAVKAAIYQHSRRTHITHKLTIDVLPDPGLAAMVTGDIVRVTQQRFNVTRGQTVHDFFYEVDDVETTDAGNVRLKLTHFPVTDSRESLYALEVSRGASLREGFAWQATPAEYGQSTVDGGPGEEENLDDVKDPPIPFDGTATFGEPVNIPEAGKTLVQVCMDKPTQTQDMTIQLVSELQAFNNQRINIPVGQQCGEVEVDTPTDSGTVGILGYTGGGWVNPDLSDEIEIGGVSIMGMFWMYDLIGGGVHSVDYRDVSSVDSLALVINSDEYRFKIGSGDGTQWITATLSTPGMSAMREASYAAASIGGFDDIIGWEGTEEDWISSGAAFLMAETPVSWQTLFKATALPLPCGNGAAVVVVRVERAAAFAGSYGVQDWSNYNWSGVGEQTYPTWSFNTGLHGPATFSGYAYKCFLVSHTTIREITAPEGFTAKLDEVFPPAQWDETEIIGYVPKWKSGFAIPLGPQFDDSEEPEPIYRPRLTYGSAYSFSVTEDYTIGKPTGSEYDPTPPVGSGWLGSDLIFETETYSRTITYPLFDSGPGVIRSLGLDLALMFDPEAGIPSYFATIGSTSPVVLSYFANQPAALAAAETLKAAGASSYSDCIDALDDVIGAPMPTSVVTVDRRDDSVLFIDQTADNQLGEFIPEKGPIYFESAEDVPGIPFVSHSPLPDSTTETLGFDETYSAVQTLSLTSPRVDPFEGDPAEVEGYFYQLRPIFFTDWGQPLHCRVQLLALGFTEEDLTPEAPAP